LCRSGIRLWNVPIGELAAGVWWWRLDLSLGVRLSAVRTKTVRHVTTQNSCWHSRVGFRRDLRAVGEGVASDSSSASPRSRLIVPQVFASLLVQPPRWISWPTPMVQ